MRHRQLDPPFTVAVASRDRVWVDSVSTSLGRHGLRVRELALAAAPRSAALAGVDVLLLDSDSLTAEDLAQAAALRRSVPLIEVVALAGDAPVADAVRALRDGVFTVLQHPVADGLLLESLIAAGRRHRHAQARFEELNGSGVTSLHRGRRKAPVAAGPGRKDRP